MWTIKKKRIKQGLGDVLLIPLAGTKGQSLIKSVTQSSKEGLKERPLIPLEKRKNL